MSQLLNTCLLVSLNFGPLKAVMEQAVIFSLLICCAYLCDMWLLWGRRLSPPSLLAEMHPRKIILCSSTVLRTYIVCICSIFRHDKNCNHDKCDIIVIKKREVGNILQEVFRSGRWVWIGLQDLVKEGVYVCVNRKKIPKDVMYWRPKKPTNSITSRDRTQSGQDCVLALSRWHTWERRNPGMTLFVVATAPPVWDHVSQFDLTGRPTV